MRPSLKRRIIEWFCDVFGHKNEYSHTYAGEKHYFCKRCGLHTGVSLTRQDEWFISESEVLEAIDRLDKLGVLRKDQK